MDNKLFNRIICFCLLLPITMVVYASVGNMDESDHWSYVETGGWANWRPISGGATVTADFLYGFIWMENAGWVNRIMGDTDDGKNHS